MKTIKQQFDEWLILGNNSIDEHGDKLCYCGHTHKCDCLDPDIDMFENSLKNGTIVLDDIENGWKNIKLD